MTVTALLTMVKFEAKSNAGTEFDTWLLDVVNEELLLLHQKHDYEEFLKDGTLSLTAATSSVSQPSDFLRLKSNARPKFYNTSDTTKYRLLYLASEHQVKLITGSPQYYQFKDSKLYVYPYSEVLSTDRVGFEYYKSPAAVIGASTIADKFANIIRHRCIARLLLYKDSKQAAAYQGLAKEKFQDSI